MHHSLDDGRDGGTDTDFSTNSSSESDTDTDTDTDTDDGPVTLVADDPLGDETPFSFVFSYLGRVWFGPSSSGTSAAYLDPTGNGITKVSFSFGKDEQGAETHRNNCANCLTYEAIGSSTCEENTPLCGPDNEDGRGIFTSGIIENEPWLVLTGAFLNDAEDSDMNYVYVSQDSDNALRFSYIDLHDVLGPQTLGCSAMHVFGDRLYLGFPDAGGKRPYLISILNMPSGFPGMEASNNGNKEDACDPNSHDACGLRGHLLPGVGLSAPVSMIDSITDFNNRLYLANNGGLVRSTRPDPLDALNYPEHWKEITPANNTYQNLVSIWTNKTTDLEPSDKAVPSMVSFKGKLYMARNTMDGPQLWSCIPALTESTADCDSGDWQLVAPNIRSNTLLTQFNNINNASISLLFADENSLYLGFNNTVDGLVVFRTSQQEPMSASDFLGAGGCTADEHPNSCDGYAGNGFGNKENSHIFSAAMDQESGKSVLYLVVGNHDGPAKVYALK